MLKFNIRTDLAIENRELLPHSESIDGVEVTTENDAEYNIETTTVSISNEYGSRVIGKPCGKYITIESSLMQADDKQAHEKIAYILAKELGNIIPYKQKALIVGLGNAGITPDSLGPKVISGLLVTRHLYNDEEATTSMEGFGNISAISPGVMGQTGMETQEIIKGIIAQTQPDYLIAIDALASRRVSRVNSTIQLSDTGILPGAGVGNARKGLNFETVGIPVVSIGVPTVVDAPTIVYDALEGILGNNYSDSEKYNLIFNSMEPELRSMFVAPKDTDNVVKKLGNIIADAINLVLHSELTRDEIRALIY